MPENGWLILGLGLPAAALLGVLVGWWLDACDLHDEKWDSYHGDVHGRVSPCPYEGWLCGTTRGRGHG